MLVTTRGLQTEEGFRSPNLNIDSNGNITATSINVASIKLDGEVLFGAGAPGDDGGGGPITSLAPSIINSSLQTFGTITSLTVNGAVQITSTPTGAINNIDIGGLTPGDGTFVNLTATNGTITTLNSTTSTLGTALATSVT